MRNDGQIPKYLNVIRTQAAPPGTVAFDGNALVEVCINAEKAGLPMTYYLPATAQEYALSRNGEQLVVTLAARVGNPRVSPVPPLWPLLALLLLRWRHTMPVRLVI